MIGQIKGNVDYINQSEIIVDVNGVGYQLQVSNAALSKISNLGDNITLVVYTDVKENAISLFGFESVLERQVFLLTKKVKGIGSKLAMNIVSSLGAEKLLVAIGRGDMDALKRVTGVGKKTAERTIVELREQVLSFVAEINDSSDNSTKSEIVSARLSSIIDTQVNKNNINTACILVPGVTNDAILALEKLGIPLERARSAVGCVLENNENLSKNSGDLVQAALGYL